MSTIGIYDADFFKYIHVPFNLECMKLAAYYKKKRDIVTMSPSFSPQYYSKFIYRKDYEDNDYPKEIYQLDNIEYGGTAFNTKYVPLEEEIEKLKPDLSIYLKYEKLFSTSANYQQAFNTMINAQHFRLSLDGNNIWKDYYKQFKNLEEAYTLFIHDLNLNDIENAYEEIQDLTEEMRPGSVGQFIALKYPIVVNNVQDIFKWINLKPSKNYFVISYEGLIPDSEFKELVYQDYSNKQQRQLEYHITKKSYDENDFINNIFPKIYRQLIFCRQYHQRILLKYDKDFFTDPTWYKVIDVLNGYTISLFNISYKKYKKIIPDDSFYSFVNSLEENPIIKTYPFSKQDARDAFQLIREVNYELFKEFYELHEVKLIGGEFK